MKNQFLLIVTARLKKQWPLTMVILLTLGLSLFLEYISPIILKDFIDINLGNFQTDGLFTRILVYLATLLGIQLLTFVLSYFMTRIGQFALLDLRTAIVKHLQALGIDFFNHTSKGEIMSRCSADVDAVNLMFTDGLITILSSFIRMLGMLLSLLAIDFRLSLLVLVLFPIMGFFTELSRQRLRRAEKETRKNVGLISANIMESLSGFRVIKSFGKEKNFLHILKRSIERFFQSRKKASWYLSLWLPLTDVFKLLITCSLFGLGVWLMHTAHPVSAGTLVAFFQVITRLFFPLINISQSIQILQQAMAGIERINEILNQKPEARPQTRPIPQTLAGRILIKNLSFSYTEGIDVLRGLNLRIEPGERVTLIGKTGAGKSSLLNLLSGVYAPVQGTIRIDDLDPRTIQPAQRRRLLGVVPQDVQLFDGSLRENISLKDPSISDSDIKAIFDQLDLGFLLKDHGYSLDSVLGQGGVTLSQGEAQLISLARALICNPALLLLDEPSSGMDSLTEKKILDLIAAESRQRTTLTISHRLSSTVDSQRILVMANGRIEQSGSPEELKKQQGWYAMFSTIENFGWEQ